MANPKSIVNNEVETSQIDTLQVDTSQVNTSQVNTSQPNIVSDLDLSELLPDFLQKAPFVFWKLIVKDGRKTKMPLKLEGNPLDSDDDFARIPNCRLVGASSTKPDDWLDFHQAVDALKFIPADKVDGLGVILSSDSNIVCIDLDKCFDKDGNLSSFAADMINRFDGAYIEISQSGKGLHIFFLDDFADALKRNRNDKLEIYSDKRFIALTGNVYNEHIGANPVMHGVANVIVNEFFAVDDQLDFLPTPDFSVEPAIPSDELINIIRHSPQAEKFNRLFDGDISEFKNNWSSADFTLCLMLCFWTNGNAKQILDIWQMSKLTKRDKFATREGDYDVRTITEAIKSWTLNGSYHFTPKKRRNSADVSTPVTISGRIVDLNLPDDWHWDISCPDNFTLSNLGTDSFETRKGGMWKRISHSVILVEKIISNVDSGLQSLQTRCLTNDGWRKLPPIPSSIFASNSKIVSLADYGIDVRSDNASLMSKWIVDFIAANKDHIDRIKSVNSPGWQWDGSFVYPNTKNQPYQLIETIRADSELIFSHHGDVKKVFPILQALHSNDIAMIVLGAALAAPIVRLVNAPNNPVVHIYGTGGCGKSTIARLAFSLFANPNAHGSIPNADISRAGADAFFASRTDFLSVIDDIDAVDDERIQAVIRKLPYQFANGAGSTRGNKDGSKRAAVEYRGALLTTGEHPINSATSRAGALRRTLELPVPDNFIPVEMARHISECIIDNFGCCGRPWINYLLNHLNNDGVSFFNYGLAKFRNHFFEHCPNKIPLLIENVALICMANHLFNVAALKIRASESQNDEALRGIRILQITPDVKAIADFERAKQFIIDFIVGHPKQFDEACVVNERFGCRRDTFTAILPTVLNAYLDKCGFDSKTVVKQLADNGFFKTDGRNLAYPVKGFGGATKVRMYRIDNSLIYGDDTDNSIETDSSHSDDVDVPFK